MNLRRSSRSNSSAKKEAKTRQLAPRNKKKLKKKNAHVVVKLEGEAPSLSIPQPKVSKEEANARAIRTLSLVERMGVITPAPYSILGFPAEQKRNIIVNYHDNFYQKERLLVSPDLRERLTKLAQQLNIHEA
jgi:hypothetical protein